MLEQEKKFQIVDWGVVSYEEANQRQLDLVHQVKEGFVPNTLVFCSHPPVVTLGRATQDEDIENWQGDVHRVSRGGRATYHGPSQLIVYPIFSLDRASGEFFHRKDVHSYLRCLESCLVKTLSQDYGIAAQVKTSSISEHPRMQMTGVWVQDKKIASIGVAVRSWVAYHGLALNVDNDPEAFRGIKPCGFSPSMMVSMEEVLSKTLAGKKICRDRLKKKLINQFCFYFS